MLMIRINSLNSYPIQRQEIKTSNQRHLPELSFDCIAVVVINQNTCNLKYKYKIIP